MIQTRKDLKFYIQEDAKRNDIKPGLVWYISHYVYGSSNLYAFRYLKYLRHCEYHANNKGLYHKLMFYIYKLIVGRLSLKYNISIPINVTGYGLRLLHLAGGGGMLINCKSMGNYCGINAGVLVGNKDSQENIATIGDYVALGPGAKVIGKVTIGDNVFVAANAVVTKDIPANSIAGGIPAKVLKQREPIENNTNYINI